MTTSGDPNEPRPGQDPREGRREEGEHPPEWWSEASQEDDQQGREERPPEPRPYESGPTGGDETRPEWAPGGPPGTGPTGGTAPEEEPATPGEKPPTPEEPPEEEPITPAPPVVPPADVPPTHEPRPGEPRPGEPPHPDLPTAPEVPPPAGDDTETTQVLPVPGATPPYPGWESKPPEEEPPPKPTPSRYEQPTAQPGAAAHEGPAPYGTHGPPVVPGTTPSSPYGGPPGYGPPPAGSPYGPYQQDRTGSGLATAALVLGVASPFLVFVCFIGVITAILSIVFGCVALAKRAGKGRAVAGIVISVLSLILFAILAIWFWSVVQECAQLPGQLADRCFQEKFPWMNGGLRT
ncbi:DUF4190 domain-containing protein [Nonomuraea sp. H19]|uniref:DUF4190 domain-containing protein n=1 Tax=Nonomuraea sp. H19 TaxID=3452206 RepID=UPI003F88ABD6